MLVSYIMAGTAAILEGQLFFVFRKFLSRPVGSQQQHLVIRSFWKRTLIFTAYCIHHEIFAT